MSKNIAARRGTLVAAALSAALVAPLAPVASAQTEAPTEARANLSSGDVFGSSANVDSKTLSFKRNVTVKRGETTSFDLNTLANLPLGTVFEVKAGGDVASVDGTTVKLAAPTKGTTKVQLKAAPKVGPALDVEFNVAAGDETKVAEAEADVDRRTAGSSLESFGSSEQGTGSSLQGTGSSENATGSSLDAVGNLTGSSNDSAVSTKCKVALVGFGVPLLALIPLGILSQLAIGGTADLREQVGAQIRGVNAELQKQAGVLNPQLAGQVEQANAALKQFGLNVGTAALAVVGVGALSAVTATLLTVCLGNDTGSSASLSSERGSSAAINGTVDRATTREGEDNAGSSANSAGSSARTETDKADADAAADAVTTADASK